MKSLEKEIRQTKPFQNEYQKATINLIFTGKWMFKLHSEMFQKYGVSLQQYNILRILRGRSPKVATIKYIKNRMLDKMSDASRIVENMVKKELILRSHNSNDRRKVDISLTIKGKEILVEIEKQHDVLFGYLSNLNTQEIKQLNNLLDKARS